MRRLLRRIVDRLAQRWIIPSDMRISQDPTVQMLRAELQATLRRLSKVQDERDELRRHLDRISGR